MNEDVLTVIYVDNTLYVDGKEVTEIPENVQVTICINGNVGNIRSESSVSVEGNVEGFIDAGNNIFIEGDLKGEASAGNNVKVQGSISGHCKAGNNIFIKNNF